MAASRVLNIRRRCTAGSRTFRVCASLCRRPRSMHATSSCRPCSAEIRCCTSTTAGSTSLLAELPAAPNHDAIFDGPRLTRVGDDLTIVAAGHSAYLAEQVAERLFFDGLTADVIDLRVINPLDSSVVCASVERTGRLLVIDGGWTSCGLAGEVISMVVERLEPAVLRARPRRLTLRDVPAPTSSILEQDYYPSVERGVELAHELLGSPVRAM